MKLYYTFTENRPADSAIEPPRSAYTDSAFAYSLLRAALRREGLADVLPHISRESKGKPYFTHRPELNFSLSHSNGHILCALGSNRVGADVQMRRELVPGFVERITVPSELEEFDFFELWTLRESLYKLRGEGNLRRMTFQRIDGVIIAPEPGVYCRSYDSVPGCSAAIVSEADNCPEDIVKVPILECLK